MNDDENNKRESALLERQITVHQPGTTDPAEGNGGPMEPPMFVTMATLAECFTASAEPPGLSQQK